MRGRGRLPQRGRRVGRSIAPMEENGQEAEEQTGSLWFPTLAVPPHVSTLDKESVREGWHASWLHARHGYRGGPYSPEPAHDKRPPPSENSRCACPTQDMGTPGRQESPLTTSGGRTPQAVHR